MVNFWLILLAAFIVALASLSGRLLAIFGWRRIKKYLHYFIGFAAGTLLGVSFFELLPESLNKIPSSLAFSYVLGGFLLFFIIEQIFYWHHCHNGECPVEGTGYLILIGDGLHNFIDGIILATAFLVDFSLGAVTTLAILFHEIPQEISDFTVLIYSGFSKSKALIYNFLIALTTILGAVIVLLFSRSIDLIIGPILAIVAGAFIYIASVDLIPELHIHIKKTKKALIYLFFVILGVIFIKLTGMIL